MTDRRHACLDDDYDEDDWAAPHGPRREKISYRERSATRREEQNKRRRQAKRQRWLEARRFPHAVRDRDNTDDGLQMH